MINKTNYGFVLGLIQFLISILTIITSFSMIMKSTSVLDIIKNFTSLAIIAQFDDFMAEEMNWARILAYKMNIKYLELKCHKNEKIQFDYYSKTVKIILCIYISLSCFLFFTFKIKIFI